MNHIQIRGHRRRFPRPGALRAMAWRSQLGVVALAAVLTAGCSSSTTAHIPSHSPAAPSSTAVAPPAAYGVQASIETIPWSKVGPGWMLALWSPVIGHRPGEMSAPNEPTREEASTTLYLVDPAGGRYPITIFPKGSAPSFVDWSGDGSHALFDMVEPGSVSGGTGITVDLRHGKQTTIPGANGGPIGYARPDGTAVLIGKGQYGRGRASLERIDLAGNQELTYPVGPDYKGGALPTPDGTQVVLGLSKGLALMGNDGTPGKALPVPGKLSECAPVRWWTATVVLAHCDDPSVLFSSTGQLWQVPTDGTTPTALTAVNSGQEDDPGFGGDIGDVDAWQLPSGTFLQSLGACGTLFLSRLTPDGHTTRVNVPGVSTSVLVNGVSGDKLVLVAKAGCGPGTSLVTYDPAANTSTVLLGSPINGGSVTEAIVYPRQ
jgi:hypothetical protein